DDVDVLPGDREEPLAREHRERVVVKPFAEEGLEIAALVPPPEHARGLEGADGSRGQALDALEDGLAEALRHALGVDVRAELLELLEVERIEPATGDLGEPREERAVDAETSGLFGPEPFDGQPHVELEPALRL